MTPASRRLFSAYRACSARNSVRHLPQGR